MTAPTTTEPDRATELIAEIFMGKPEDPSALCDGAREIGDGVHFFAAANAFLAFRYDDVQRSTSGGSWTASRRSPPMLAAGHPGHILNTASMQGVTSGPLIPDYAVSKRRRRPVRSPPRSAGRPRGAQHHQSLGALIV